MPLTYSGLIVAAVCQQKKKKNSRQLSAGSPPHMLSQRRLTKCNQQTQSKRLRELKSVLKQQKSDFSKHQPQMYLWCVP